MPKQRSHKRHSEWRDIIRRMFLVLLCVCIGHAFLLFLLTTRIPSGTLPPPPPKDIPHIWSMSEEDGQLTEEALDFLQQCAMLSKPSDSLDERRDTAYQAELARLLHEADLFRNDTRVTWGEKTSVLDRSLPVVLPLAPLRTWILPVDLLYAVSRDRVLRRVFPPASVGCTASIRTETGIRGEIELPSVEVASVVGRYFDGTSWKQVSVDGLPQDGVRKLSSGLRQESEEDMTEVQLLKSIQKQTGFRDIPRISLDVLWSEAGVPCVHLREGSGDRELDKAAVQWAFASQVKLGRPVSKKDECRRYVIEFLRKDAAL